MNAKEFLSFRTMITPVIIQVLFWLGVVLCIIGGLVGIIAGAAASFGGGVQVLGGILVLILGPVFVRIYCELLILAFRMYDSLKSIEKNTGGAGEGKQGM